MPAAFLYGGIPETPCCVLHVLSLGCSPFDFLCILQCPEVDFVEAEDLTVDAFWSRYVVRAINLSARTLFSPSELISEMSQEDAEISPARARLEFKLES